MWAIFSKLYTHHVMVQIPMKDLDPPRDALKLAEMGPNVVTLAVLADRLCAFPHDVRVVPVLLDTLIRQPFVLQRTSACKIKSSISDDFSSLCMGIRRE